MPNEIMSIDPSALATVSGGKSYDPILKDITNLASQLKDVNKATSGFNSTTTFLLFALALQRNSQANTNVVYVRRW